MAGVYISFPFCAQKCTYCNFASGVFPKELESRYLSGLAAEIGAHEWAWTPETVYIGGGTPSRLDGNQLDSLLRHVPGRPWKETTIEVAPGDVTTEKAAAWRNAGISRVSLGVQSFQQKELAQTGRRHTGDTVVREVAMLRDAGISNINLDLIAGLPHQTVQSFEQSLECVRNLNVPHVSVYMLEVDEDSNLGNEILGGGGRYGAERLPPDEEIVAMYKLAAKQLALMGVPRYEISNFARPGVESMHNLKYWRMEPYVGFGADAHSFDGRVRSQNVETAAEYVERLEQRKSAVRETTPADFAEERLMTGLRLDRGIDLNEQDLLRHGASMERFAAQGLIERSGSRVRLTSQGVIFSNEVFEEFVQA